MSSTSELRDVFQSVTGAETVTDEQDPEARADEADPEALDGFDVESVRNDSLADTADDMEVEVR